MDIPYFAAVVAGFAPAPAAGGCKSRLKYVVAVNVATMLSFGAY
jgi:hypothetical protein